VDSTMRSYSALWQDFVGFAEAMSAAICPAAEATVLGFVTWLDLSGRGGRASTALAAIAWAHMLHGVPSPTGLPRVRLRADGLERAWPPRPARGGKLSFTRYPFPVKALHAHVQRGADAGPLWLRAALLVALGLRSTTAGCTFAWV
jgi:hypothetical protein